MSVGEIGLIFALCMIVILGGTMLSSQISQIYPQLKWKYKGPPKYITPKNFYIMASWSMLNIEFIGDENSIDHNAVLKSEFIPEVYYRLHVVPIWITGDPYTKCWNWLTAKYYVREDEPTPTRKFSLQVFDVPPEYAIECYTSMAPFTNNRFWSIYLDNSMFGPSFCYENIGKELDINCLYLWDLFATQFGMLRIGAFTGFAFPTQEQAEAALEWIDAYELARQMVNLR